MKKWVRFGLAIVVTASMTNLDAPDADAGFGLLKKLFGKKTECCCEPEPVCCEPEPVCCEPEPVCCEPEPVCCEPEPVCCEPEPEPVCCEPEPAPEPVCCEPEPEPCCEPEPEPEPCCEPAPEPEPCCEPEPEPCCASYALPELAEGEVLVSITPISSGVPSASGSLSTDMKIVFTAPKAVTAVGVATTLTSVAK